MRLSRVSEPHIEGVRAFIKFAYANIHPKSNINAHVRSVEIA